MVWDWKCLVIVAFQNCFELCIKGAIRVEELRTKNLRSPPYCLCIVAFKEYMFHWFIISATATTLRISYNTYASKSGANTITFESKRHKKCLLFGAVFNFKIASLKVIKSCGGIMTFSCSCRCVARQYPDLTVYIPKFV